MRWAKTFALGAIVSAILSACSHAPETEPSKMDPPSTEIRKRVSQIVLRVYSDAKPGWHANEEVIVGAGDGAAHGAKAGVKAGLVGLVPAAAGCHPDWRELWPITCPIGIAVGIGTGIASAVVGSAGGAAYGAIAANSPEAMKSAVANLDRAVLETKIENALHVELVHTIQQSTSSAIAEDEPFDDAGVGESFPIGKVPIILAIQIDEFSLTQKGRLSPDLWLSFQVSGGLYDAVKVVPIHERGWVLETKLGDFVGLLEGDGSALQKKFGKVFKKVAAAIVDDIFVTYESRLIAGYPESGEMDRILAKYSSIKNANIAEYDDQRQKAGCGDPDAQLELGKAYAAVDGRIYGWRARQSWVEAYKWLKLAEGAGKEEAGSSLAEFQPKLTPLEIASAEKSISDFRPRKCPQKNGEDSHAAAITHPDRVGAEIERSDDAPVAPAEKSTSHEITEDTIATAQPADQSCPVESQIDFPRDRNAIEQVLSAALDTSGGYNQVFHEFNDIRVQSTQCGEIKITTTYTLEQTYWGGTNQYTRKVVLIKNNNQFFVEHVGS